MKTSKIYTNKVCAVAIVSGGLDSVTMLYEYNPTHALFFNYGSKHNHREVEFARMHCERIGTHIREIDMTFINDMLQSDLLKSGGEISDDVYSMESLQKTVVPFRNGIMLSIAVAYADSHRLNPVLIGTHAGDHAIYPDCRIEFTERFSGASIKGTFNHVKVLAPYMKISKKEIAKKSFLYGFKPSETWSCYKGREKQCGVCSTCRERRFALGENDDTDYEQEIENG